MPATPSDVGAQTGIQSAMERTIDFVDEQIPPPSSEAGTESGFSLFSDPKAKRSAIKTGATLTLVISMFLLVVFLWRLKPGTQKPARGNNEVLAVLGKVPFVHGQQLQVIRLGTRLLLVATSPKGSQTLAEISDPQEVLQIEGAFRQGRMDLLTESLHNRSLRNATQRNGVSLGSQQQHGRTLLEA